MALLRRLITLVVAFSISIGSAEYIQGQTVKNLIQHDGQGENLTYTSVAKDGTGRIFTATSFEASYTIQGKTIEKLKPESLAEVLFCSYDNTGALLNHKRIAITPGSGRSVGRVEFLAVDSAGFAYLSTQGNSQGSGFVRVEEDSVEIVGSGSLVIQLYPDGRLRSVRVYPQALVNVVAHDTVVYVGYRDVTNGNAARLDCFDTTFTEPLWTLTGNGNLTPGALAFDRSQIAISPDGEHIAWMLGEGAGPATFAMQPVPFNTSEGFDEVAVLLINRNGNLVRAKTFFGSPSTVAKPESPHALAVGNDGSITASVLSVSTSSFASSTIDTDPTFNSRHCLVLRWDADGNEQWATPFLSKSQSPRIDGISVTNSNDVIIGASWGTEFKLGGVSGTLTGSPCLTAKLSGSDGTVLWTVIPSVVNNTVNGQRTLVLDDDSYVMVGKAFSGFQFAGLAPAGDLRNSEFMLFIDEEPTSIENRNNVSTALPFRYNADHDVIEFTSELSSTWLLFDMHGNRALSGAAVEGTNLVDVSSLSTGWYVLQLAAEEKSQFLTFVKY